MRDGGKDCSGVSYDELYSECAEEHLEYLDEAGNKSALMAVAKYARKTSKISPSTSKVISPVKTIQIVEQQEPEKAIKCRLCMSELPEVGNSIFDKDIEKFLNLTNIVSYIYLLNIFFL